MLADNSSVNPGAPNAGRGQQSVRAHVMLVSAVAVAIDFLTKQAAVTLLEGEPPVSVIGSLLRLWVGRNPGAAFSLGAEGSTLVFTIIAIAAIAALVIWMPRIIASVDSRLMVPTVALAMAGAAGNLIDRLVRAPGFGHGHVVDFIALPNFPIFNVSDVCITAAAALYILANFGVGRAAGKTPTSGGASE